MVQDKLYSRGMIATLVAQFFSAFGDNALLFSLLALIKQLNYPTWSMPILQIVFVATFIISVPITGQVADCFSKGRVMLCANLLKLVGAVAICLGIEPFIGYLLVGFGAATYSPAKYGILGELTSKTYLVKANSLIESSTICAILLGSVAGGYLSDINVMGALLFCVMVQLFALIANLFIPKLPAVNKEPNWQIIVLLKDFYCAIKQLVVHTQGQISLLGTGLLWGAAITLRFLLIAWVPLVLGLTDNTTPTILNAVIAIGIIIGAMFAGKLVNLNTSLKVIPAGIFMGFAVAGFTLQSEMLFIYALLIIIGILAGIFVIPLNALLQDIGRRTTGAGKAIAVQKFIEYSSMVVMLSLYAITVALDVSIITIGVMFGLLFSIAIFGLWILAKRK